MVTLISPPPVCIALLYTDGLAMFKEQRVHSWVFVHDKASVHPGGSLYLKEKGQLVVEDWPSKGMDLNVMENVWAQVDRMSARAPHPYAYTGPSNLTNFGHSPIY